MQRNRSRPAILATAVAAFALATMPALAQQLRQPPPPLQPPASPTQDAAPRIVQPATAPSLPSSPSQRAATAPIKATTGDKEPSQPASAKQAQAGDEPQAVDANGRPVRGMVKVAPNRVRDTATGRYYWVSPAGRLLPDSGND
jgi:hypothetical protein